MTFEEWESKHPDTYPYPVSARQAWDAAMEEAAKAVETQALGTIDANGAGQIFIAPSGYRETIVKSWLCGIADLLRGKKSAPPRCAPDCKCAHCQEIESQIEEAMDEEHGDWK